jgi:hypothetical protein
VTPRHSGLATESWCRPVAATMRPKGREESKMGIDVAEVKKRHAVPSHDHDGCDVCQLVDEVERLIARHDVVSKREAELHEILQPEACHRCHYVRCVC